MTMFLGDGKEDSETEHL